ncbi:CIA30 family protein [Roseisalinus antarcticus]|uniref:Complex I intermediate-associated protein 30 (CIA30) n=1 Tax=Roseisalinus antarcticus TaxID=254357 RepID=A0A1Y5TIW5_9RHOB|nr:CIA30 family protein [Roseisalinus antarcticus]SLN64681.1 Complex I intermediate-associated protein 30 (CIA30) [Roseisalinus antarcticus]
MELSPDWEFVADTVMGGVSRGQVTREMVGGRQATRLTGAVSLENNGGFVQMAFDLAEDGGPFDASEWDGIELEVRGNDEAYDLRLRTDRLTRPWQSFRADFVAPAEWTLLRFPFESFEPHRTDAPFEPSGLRRVGVLGIGRVFDADVAVSAIRLYVARPDTA